VAVRTPIDSFRRASLLTRTLITVVSLLGVFAVFVAGMSVIAVTVTRAVFPAATEQSLASPPAASEAEEPGPAPASPGRAAPTAKKTRGTTAKRQGDPKE